MNRSHRRDWNDEDDRAGYGSQSRGDRERGSQQSSPSERAQGRGSEGWYRGSDEDRWNRGSRDREESQGASRLRDPRWGGDELLGERATEERNASRMPQGGRYGSTESG